MNLFAKKTLVFLLVGFFCLPLMGQNIEEAIDGYQKPDSVNVIDGFQEPDNNALDVFQEPDSNNVKEVIHLSSQEPLDFTILPPANIRNWNTVKEGEQVNLKIAVNNAGMERHWYYVIEGDELGASIDTLGNFTWIPSYDLVDRLEKEKIIIVQFEVRNEQGHVARKSVDFTVLHVNRPPVVGDLKNFYVQANVDNTYRIDLNMVTDPDNDPIVFRPIPQIMPEGAQLSENGIFKWKPSVRQFNSLAKEPIILSFIVEDQPAKAQTRSSFTILVTQMDLPPEIAMIPNVTRVVTKENENVNFKFFLSDPNGDEDIADFNLISDDLRVTNKYLIQNSLTQWEFVWMPGYDFVRDGMDSIAFDLTFFVVDKSRLRSEKRVRIKVLNTPNQEQIDRTYYSQYRGSLTRIWDLLQQLEEREKDYYKRLRKATRGRTRLAITDASVGAVTAMSPLMIEDPKSKKMVTGIGGTTTMTMGTLKAANVINKSPNEIIQNLNKIIEKKNELLVHGNVYARRYSSVVSRRDKDYQKDSENLLSRLLLRDVATLELDAGWMNPKPPNDDAIKHVFPDFIADLNL
jgi:hypothetical protein